MGVDVKETQKQHWENISKQKNKPHKTIGNIFIDSPFNGQYIDSGTPILYIRSPGRGVLARRALP